MSNRVKIPLYIVLFFMQCGFPSLTSAQIRVTFEDLAKEPERFYDMEIRLIGKVIIVHEGGYVIQNDVGRIVEIVSKNPPEIEIKYDIVVKVTQKPDSYEPLLMEMKRKKYTGGNSWLIIFAVLILSGVFAAGG